MTTAHKILQAAQKHMKDRAKKYDSPSGERSVAATVAAFNAVTDSSMTEEQGWLFMALLKAVRSQQGDYHADSYEDGAAYFALAGEAAYVDRMLSNEVREAILDALDKCGPAPGSVLSQAEAPEGWIEWDGYSPYGPPIKDSTSVQVLCRDKNKLTGLANQFSWRHLGSHEDIIAYRIIE